MITLKTAEGELIIDPKNGGCVSAFRWHGQDILRPFTSSNQESKTPTAYAAFPLMPFSGRIANGEFSYGGKQISLHHNFPPEPHAIHGHGWERAWTVTKKDNTSLVIEFSYREADWPWAYNADQHFTLTPDGLKLELSITNTSSSTMPAGIGWHPYFPVEGACVRSDVSAIWLSGDDMIPSAPSPLSADNDLREMRDVQTLQLDNAFDVNSGETHLYWEKEHRAVKMTASDTLRRLIVFTPQDTDFFCIEPVSHAPNAVNSGQPDDVTGLKHLEPGETLSGTITLSVEIDV